MPDDITESFFVAQEQQTPNYSIPWKTDLDHIRDRQGFRDSPALSAPVSVFVVVALAVMLVAALYELTPARP